MSATVEDVMKGVQAQMRACRTNGGFFFFVVDQSGTKAAMVVKSTVLDKNDGKKTYRAGRMLMRLFKKEQNLSSISYSQGAVQTVKDKVTFLIEKGTVKPTKMKIAFKKNQFLLEKFGREILPNAKIQMQDQEEEEFTKESINNVPQEWLDNHPELANSFGVIEIAEIYAAESAYNVKYSQRVPQKAEEEEQMLLEQAELEETLDQLASLKKMENAARVAADLDRSENLRIQMLDIQLKVSKQAAYGDNLFLNNPELLPRRERVLFNEVMAAETEIYDKELERISQLIGICEGMSLSYEQISMNILNIRGHIKSAEVAVGKKLAANDTRISSLKERVNTLEQNIQEQIYKVQSASQKEGVTQVDVDSYSSQALTMLAGTAGGTLTKAQAQMQERVQTEFLKRVEEVNAIPDEYLTDIWAGSHLDMEFSADVDEVEGLITDAEEIRIHNFILRTNFVLRKTIEFINEERKKSKEKQWPLDMVDMNPRRWLFFYRSSTTAKEKRKVLADLESIQNQLSMITSKNSGIPILILKSKIANTWLVRFKPLLAYVPLNISFAHPAACMKAGAYSQHLMKFSQQGGHAFISKFVHNMVMNRGWDGWGRDSNFIMPTGPADEVFTRAQTEQGIKTIEESCGVPPGQWYNEQKKIYRYYIDFKKLQELNEDIHLRLPRGDEAGADARAFRQGGLAGSNNADEAVIDAFDFTKLKRLMDEKVITIEEHVLPSTPTFDKESRTYKDP